MLFPSSNGVPVRWVAAVLWATTGTGMHGPHARAHLPHDLSVPRVALALRPSPPVALPLDARDVQTADGTVDAASVTAWDPLGNRGLPRGTAGSVATPVGTVLDTASCLAGLGPRERARTVSRFATAVSVAVSRAARCAHALGFSEMRAVVSVLRRTRIRCARFADPTTIAWMEMTRELPGHRGGVRQSAGAGLDYQMTVSRAQVQGMRLDDVAAAMAHEAMHALPMNNRAWHNEMLGREKYGCVNSEFTDRIYLTQAACFPDSQVGAMYYDPRGAVHCPDVCLQALTGVDASVAASLAQVNSPDALHGVLGPPLVSAPYSNVQARNLCTWIRKTGGSR